MGARRSRATATPSHAVPASIDTPPRSTKSGSAPMYTSAMLPFFAARADVRASELKSSSLAGSYAYVPAVSDDLSAAIAAGTDGANWIVRSLARRTLSRSLAPSDLITIEFDSKGVTITTENGQRLRSPLDGRAVETREVTGEQLAVRPLA